MQMKEQRFQNYNFVMRKIGFGHANVPERSRRKTTADNFQKN